MVTLRAERNMLELRGATERIKNMVGAGADVLQGTVDPTSESPSSRPFGDVPDKADFTDLRGI